MVTAELSSQTTALAKKLLDQRKAATERGIVALRRPETLVSDDYRQVDFAGDTALSQRQPKSERRGCLNSEYEIGYAVLPKHQSHASSASGSVFVFT